MKKIKSVLSYVPILMLFFSLSSCGNTSTGTSTGTSEICGPCTQQGTSICLDLYQNKATVHNLWSEPHTVTAYVPFGISSSSLSEDATINGETHHLDWTFYGTGNKINRFTVKIDGGATYRYPC